MISLSNSGNVVHAKMQRNKSACHSKITTALICALCMLSNSVFAQKPQPAHTPYSFTEILRVLEAGVDPTAYVQQFGVTFVATPEMEKILRDYRATDALMTVIPKIPRPQPAAIQIRCEPVDCDLIVNDRYYGATANHLKQIELPGSGDLKIIGIAKGFEIGIVNATFTAGTQLSLSLPLNPASEVTALREKEVELRKNEVFIKLLVAIGGIEGVADIQKRSVTGNFSVLEPDAKPLKFSIVPTGPGYSVSILVDKGHCSSLFLPSSSLPDCKGKNLPPQSMLEEIYNLFKASNLAIILDDFTNKQFTLEETSDGFSLTLPNVKLALNNEFLPRSITKKTPAENIKFDNYESINGKQIPTQIVVNGTSSTGKPLSETYETGTPVIPSGGKY